MSLESYFEIVPAAVRKGYLPRHRIVENGPSLVSPNRSQFAFGTAHGLPRTWSLALGALDRTWDDTRPGGTNSSTAHDQIGRMEQASTRFGAVRELALDPVDDLSVTLLTVYEGNTSQTGAVVSSDPESLPTLHMVSVGDTRVYVHRADIPLRLTPRNDGARGFVGGETIRSELQLSHNDVILCGSAGSFSETSVLAMTSLLAADRKVALRALVKALVAPLRKTDEPGFAFAARFAL